MRERVNWITVLKYAGAFVAFMIGSGFATGQEVMQFFTAYGIWSIGGIFISMFLFAWSGSIIMKYGFENRFNDNFNSFHYFCGRILGTFLEYFIPVFLFAVVVVMISGSGATMNQYFGLPHYVGAGIMTILVMVTNMFGLKRLVDIIGSLGPITIIFTILIAIGALIKNPGGLANVSQAMAQLGELPRATSSSNAWWLAGTLYVAYNVTGSIPFLNEMGKRANSSKEAVLGAILGAVALMTAGLLLNLALLAYIGDIAELSIPNLHFAELITPVFGMIFSLILLGEIFSTAAPMLWVSADKIGKEGTMRNKIAIVVLSIFAFFGGQLPFGMLIGTVYPYTGYLGIIVLATITIKFLIDRKRRIN
ncbi:MAG: hypothetical protein GXY91_10050 [Clostridia bacterium]|nr:hypothetical protein [Clostridia bacterium]